MASALHVICFTLLHSAPGLAGITLLAVSLELCQTVTCQGRCDRHVGISEQGEAVSAQVTFPPWLQGPPDSPEAKLQGVIKACLRVRLKDRWPSDVVHLTLHAMMLQYGWSSGMMDT